MCCGDDGRMARSGLVNAGRERERFQAAARGAPPRRRCRLSGAARRVVRRQLQPDVAARYRRIHRQPAVLGQLIAKLDDAPSSGGVVAIHPIGGMSGIGKTTLAVHAAHQLAPDFPDGQIGTLGRFCSPEGKLMKQIEGSAAVR